MTPSPNIVSDRYIVINVRGAYEIFCAIEYLYKTFLTRMQCDTTLFTSCCHNFDFCIVFLRQSANSYRHCSFFVQISPVMLKKKQ
jgi:hypothetical protein